MPFFVPERFADLIDTVVPRFRLLLHKQVVTGIDEWALDGWLSNFTTREDQYLAARLLESLTFRSGAMIASSINHLLECLLPCELRKVELFDYQNIEAFREALQQGNENNPLRFVAIEGSVDDLPGKSGSLIIRHYRQLANIGKGLTCRPENIAKLPDSVRVLVFVDDMVGTGKQFLSFAKHYRLAEQATARRLYYCPLMAYVDGTSKIRRQAPWIQVLPVEEINSKQKFFQGSEQDQKLWKVDLHNSVADVREHMRSLCEHGNIPPSTKYTLDLLLGFEHSTPNNTLPIMWARSNRWNPLLRR